jgi:pimeloyl-ACP methyl ester carboxylesterase
VLIAKTYWGGAPFRFREPPAGCSVESVLLRTADHREVTGLWWTASEAPTTAVIALHPRVDFTRHYTFPALLEAGIGCLGLASRSLNDDSDCVHEELIFELAVAIAQLRNWGVDHVVLLGNSGGGSLAALYQAQALAEPDARIDLTPGGAPTNLVTAELSPADGLIYLAAHPGQGRVLARCIDPAVVDEGDPMITDPALDMYIPENGFAEPPAWSAYDDAFIKRFRRGQESRIERLDARARAFIAEGRNAARALRDASSLDTASLRGLARRKAFQPLMVVYRTMANPDYVDRSREPSAREYGSLLSDRPDRMNWQRMGLSRIVTPRAWLSTWSARSSNADMFANLPRISTPSLMIHAGADREIHPVAQRRMSEALTADDRSVETIDAARHYFEPEFGSTACAERDAMFTRLVGWLRERFPL